MKRIIIALAIVFLFVSVAMAAGPKTYQVTGPVLEIKDNVIVVQKGKDKWEVARDKDTKVKGDLKVGSKVTIEYTMTAATVDVKDAGKKAAEKKPAKKEAPPKSNATRITRLRRWRPCRQVGPPSHLSPTCSGIHGGSMATQPVPILVAKSTEEIYLYPKMANRHGLIAGATGTGKTVTLRVLAEQFSAMGVPVFMADVKGDLSGIAKAGGDNPKIADRVEGAETGGVCLRVLSRRLLGCLRGQGPPDPDNGLRDGAPSAVPHPEPERNPGRRSQHRLQDRRRQRPAAPRSQGPPVHGAVRGGQREPVQGPVRKHLQGQCRGDPAKPPRHRGAGRREVFRRACPRYQRSHAGRRRRAGGSSTSSWPTS